MRFFLPFAYAVHYALLGSTVTHENLPWKIILARNGSEAVRKFKKKYPKYMAMHVIKI